MAKNIRWYLDFVSLQGVHYRVDIYDEGTFTPVQLTAGPTPFVTDEDASDDFFCPVRSQSGTLQVCTLMPDGNYITLDELLPANNIARPVRLINRDNSNAIEWQGFLSCEAYSQDYTGIPQILDLPLISVLEAMASVRLDQTRSTGLVTVGAAIKAALNEITIQSGMDFYDYVNRSDVDAEIYGILIDQILFFKRNEYNNENSTTYIVDGISVKEVLSRIATYMGWVVREQGRTIYFERLMDDSVLKTSITYATFGTNSTQGEMILIEDKNMTDLEWRGTDHKRTILQGAKSVEVVANLAKYNLHIEIPDCPVGSLSESYYSLNDIPQYLYELGNSNAQAYSNCSFAYYGARCFVTYTNWEAYWADNFGHVFSHMAAGGSSTAKAYTTNYSPGVLRQFNFYAGAFLAKYSWENSGSATAHTTNNALHCIFFPRSINAGWEPNQSNFDRTKVSNIFSINSITDYRCNSGYLCVKAIADTIFMLPEEPLIQHHTDLDREWIVVYELQFGNKWWNGASWQNTQCTFNATMTKNGFKPNWDETMHIEETEGLIIPISGLMSGIVTLKIWPLASSPSGYEMESQATLEMLFTQLSVDHILPDNDLLTDRSENHYFRLLGTNFRDEISIGTELASNLNNKPSPSILWDDPNLPMETILYHGMGRLRPEVELLNRLAAYYSAKRQRIDLIVKHPVVDNQQAALPLLRLNGISPDNRKYLPLAESRDWQTDVCKLTCFETPQ